MTSDRHNAPTVDSKDAVDEASMELSLCRKRMGPVAMAEERTKFEMREKKTKKQKKRLTIFTVFA